jgi:hypothetical protein
LSERQASRLPPLDAVLARAALNDNERGPFCKTKSGPRYAAWSAGAAGASTAGFSAGQSLHASQQPSMRARVRSLASRALSKTQEPSGSSKDAPGWMRKTETLVMVRAGESVPLALPIPWTAKGFPGRRGGTPFATYSPSCYPQAAEEVIVVGPVTAPHLYAVGGKKFIQVPERRGAELRMHLASHGIFSRLRTSDWDPRERLDLDATADPEVVQAILDLWEA